MTAPLFDDVVREVIAADEVQGALRQITEVGAASVESLENELAGQLKSRQHDCYQLVAAEAARHQ